MTNSASSGRVTSSKTPSFHVTVTEEAAARRSEVVHLWKAGFGVDTDGSEARYDWFYLREAPAPSLHLLRLASSSELIGFVGIGPREWWIKGRCLKAGVLVDFVVLPEHRTLLPAMSLQKHARRLWLERNFLLYALPNERSTPIFKRLGASIELELGEYVRLLRPKTFLSRHLPKPIAKLASAVIALCSRAVLAAQLWTCGLSADYEETFGTEFTELWQRHDKKELSIGTRDASYLSWRFSEQPGRCYRTLAIRERTSRELRGYFVCEISDGVVYVRDFLIDGNLRQRIQALRLLSRMALIDGMESVRIAVTEVPGILNALRAALFVRRGGRPVFCSVASAEVCDWRRAAWYFTPADEDV